MCLWCPCTSVWMCVGTWEYVCEYVCIDGLCVCVCACVSYLWCLCTCICMFTWEYVYAFVYIAYTIMCVRACACLKSLYMWVCLRACTCDYEEVGRWWRRWCVWFSYWFVVIWPDNAEFRSLFLNSKLLVIMTQANQIPGTVKIKHIPLLNIILSESFVFTLLKIIVIKTLILYILT